MRFLILLATAATFCGAFAAHTDATIHNSPSEIFASTRFYTNYEHLAVTFVVGYDDQCVKDEYGFYATPGCDGMDANDAPWDIRVYQTSPTWRFVYSDRSDGFGGHDTATLFWQFQLHAPYCYSGRRWARSYKAVLRLFSPVDDRVLARDTEIFGLHCS